MIDFIGVGAQKAGTSWVYACLYEHPGVCAPIKELHFFSRPRFSKGRDWYEAHFKRCDKTQKIGEFSTSYLYSKDAPGRIKEMYPDVKLIAILRNPRERSYSQYRNSLRAGEIGEEVSYEQYLKEEQSCIKQGLYAEQLQRYYRNFREDQILVLIYEDSKKDPLTFIQTIYRFLNLDDTFVPAMLHRKINIARNPKYIGVERVMHHIAEFLRRIGFDKIVWLVKKSGLPDLVRSTNTVRGDSEDAGTVDNAGLKKVFQEDVEKLSKLIGRDMGKEWDI
jgi:hypothetical protein